MKKVTLTNTTVRYTSKANNFSVSKGKGNGRQIASFTTMDEAIKFDNDFNKLDYKNIIQKSTGKKGGVYFYIGTSKMFDKNHPFYGDFKIVQL